MWIVELTFTGEPERLAARADHRRRLASLHGQGVVRMAGPLTDDSGAVIVVDVPDRQALESFIAADPYFSTNGVGVRRIVSWRPFLS